MLLYYVGLYFEIKQQKWSICTSVEYMRVCKIWLLKCSGYRNVGKKHRGHFYRTPCTFF